MASENAPRHAPLRRAPGIPPTTPHSSESSPAHPTTTRATHYHTGKPRRPDNSRCRSAPVLQFLCHHRLHCRGDLCGQPARSAVVSQFDPHHTAPAHRLRQLRPELPHGAHLLVLRTRGPRHGCHVQALRGAEVAVEDAAILLLPV